MPRPRLARPGRTLRLLDLAPLAAGPGEEAIQASVTDLEAMTAACRGADAVIHLAGIPGEASWPRRAVKRGVPSSAEPISRGSMDENRAAWPAFTLPLMASAVPLALARLWRTDRGRAWPPNTASAAASAAETSTVSAAEITTGR